MNKKQLIKELKEIKNNGVWENDIPTIQNLLIDYENEGGNGVDDYIYRFETMERLLDHVGYLANQYDFRGIQNIMEWIEKADYYKFDGDSYENIDNEDIEEWLNDIIYFLENN